MKRRYAFAAVGLAAATLLAGCVAPPEAPAPAPQLERAAALVNEQASRVIADTSAQLAAADAKLDPTLLTDRVQGDALTVRSAEYKIAAATPERPPSTLPAQMQAVYVSAEEGWPRMLASVSVQPGDNLTPVVSLWLQDDVNTPYSLRSWAHMIPGASMPSMASDTTGARQLLVTDTSVTPTPQAAIEGYLEFLRGGRDNARGAEYAPDTYSERLFAARDVLTQAAAGASGTYTDTIEPDFEHTYVFATADGGALVFAPVTITSAFTVTNAKVSVAAADRALVEGTLTNTVTHHYRDLVVMYIPGPGSQLLPGVVAADHHLIKITP